MRGRKTLAILVLMLMISTLAIGYQLSYLDKEKGWGYRVPTKSQFFYNNFDRNKNKIEDQIDTQIRANIKKEDELIRVIVSTDQKVDSKLLYDYALLDANIIYSYKIINATAMSIPIKNLNALSKVKGVEMIHADHRVHALLDSSVPVIKADEAYTYGVDGSGVTIAVIDTGIDNTHESLDDLDDDLSTNDPKVIGFKDFVNNQDNPYDDNGHGTHCASIAAGTGGDSRYIGVAPNAKLVGVKVLDAYGYGYSSDVIAGIEWVVEHKDEYDIKVISMSLGSDQSSDGTDPVEVACDNAVEADISFAVAAGNSGPYNGTVGIPASAFNVITVGAIDDDMEIAYFSSKGPTLDGRIKPEVCAVGVDVTAADANSGNQYISYDGTSMATPHVAGVVALLLEYDPLLTPSEVKQIFLDSSIDMGDVGPDNTYGWGVVDTVKALDLAIPLEHELLVYKFKAPTILEPGTTASFNATIWNKGKSVENNVVVNFMVDNDIVDSTTISQLVNRSSENISFLWAPTTQGVYNISVKVENVSGETIISNNIKNAIVLAEPDIKIENLEMSHNVPREGEAVEVLVNVSNIGPIDAENVTVELSANSFLIESKSIQLINSVSSQIISFDWTPDVTGSVNLSARALPLRGEDIVSNNENSKAIVVVSVGTAVVGVVDSYGTDSDVITETWDILNENWTNFGNTPIYIDYITLNKDNFTYQDLENSGVDVIFISCAYDWEFTDDEISAIKKYTFKGHGLIATAGTFYYTSPNNNKLCGLFGMKEDLTYTAMLYIYGYIDILSTLHPLFTNVSNPYIPSYDTTGAPEDDYSWDENDLALGTYVALSDYLECAIITNRGVVYISNWPEVYSNNDDLQLLYNAMTWSNYTIYEHDMMVEVEMPPCMELGASATINASVYNLGLKDETNVQVEFRINGTLQDSKSIAYISKGEIEDITFTWNPASEGSYNLTVHVLPVSGEDYTIDNEESKDICVVKTKGRIKAVVLDSGGTYLSDYFIWDELIQNWYLYGDYIIDIDYTTLDKQEITYSDIESTNADVLIISDAWSSSNGWEFTDNEIEAISSYVRAGHGLIGTSGTLNSEAPNNMKLAPLFGIDSSMPGTWAEYFNSYFDLIYPDNSLFVGIADPYITGVYVTDYGLITDSSDPGLVVAESTDSYAKIVQYKGAETSPGSSIYFTHFPELVNYYGYEANAMDKQVFYNALVWTKENSIRYQHDIGLTLSIPSSILSNEETSINVSVNNFGLNDESNLELQFFIDGTLNDTLQIPFIQSGSKFQTSFNLSLDEGTYNITAYVPPVPNENYTYNNEISKNLRIISYSFFDNAENQSSKWILSNFSLSTKRSYSPIHSYYSGSGNNLNNSMKMKSPISLQQCGNPELGFYIWYNCEKHFDYTYVQVSIDGETWETLDTYNGLLDWTEKSYDISNYFGNNLYIRILYDTDHSISYEGVYVDDIYIFCSGNTTTCDLTGDYSPCSVITLSEVIDFINLWVQGQAKLSDVIALITAWASG